jgi:hypothetical protein
LEHSRKYFLPHPALTASFDNGTSSTQLAAMTSELPKLKFKGALKEPIYIATRRPGLLTSSPEELKEIENYNRLEYSKAFVRALEKINDLQEALGLHEKSEIHSSTLQCWH